MKLYVKSLPVIIDVEVVTDHFLFHITEPEAKIVAATDASRYNLPTGEVISKYKERVTQQMIDDFESFMDIVEYECEHKYKLVGVYKNISDDHSHYYNYLAQDEDDNIIIDYRFRLRISNHPPKRTRIQQENKNEELNSNKLHDLLTQEEIDSLEIYPKQLTVNGDKYFSYEDAMHAVIKLVERAIEVMTRYQEYRHKKPLPEKYKTAGGFDYVPEDAGR